MWNLFGSFTEPFNSVTYFVELPVYCVKQRLQRTGLFYAAVVGLIPANVDIKTGIWRRWKELCWQEMSLTFRLHIFPFELDRELFQSMWMMIMTMMVMLINFRLYSLVQQSVETVKRVYFIYLLPSDWATSENASNVFSVGWVYSVSLCEREILWKILKYLLWINHLHFQKEKKILYCIFYALLTVLLRLQAEHIWD